MDISLNLTESKSGDWEVRKFTIDKNAAFAFNLGCLMNHSNRLIKEGEYWKLLCNGEVVMSNTPAEVNDHLPFIRKATGKVLIAGLGLGMVLTELLKKTTITKIVVVEKSKDVIKLVSPHYKDERLQIVNEDIFNFHF